MKITNKLNKPQKPKNSEFQSQNLDQHQYKLQKNLTSSEFESRKKIQSLQSTKINSLMDESQRSQIQCEKKGKLIQTQTFNKKLTIQGIMKSFILERRIIKKNVYQKVIYILNKTYLSNKIQIPKQIPHCSFAKKSQRNIKNLQFQLNSKNQTVKPKLNQFDNSKQNFKFPCRKRYFSVRNNIKIGQTPTRNQKLKQNKEESQKLNAQKIYTQKNLYQYLGNFKSIKDFNSKLYKKRSSSSRLSSRTAGFSDNDEKYLNEQQDYPQIIKKAKIYF